MTYVVAGIGFLSPVFLQTVDLMRNSLALRRVGLKTHSKFPALVSYNKLPWEQLAAHSYKLHEAVALHYSQLLDVAFQRSVPQLVLEDHIAPPHDLALRLLPGTVYFLPSQEGTNAVPEGWDAKPVEDAVAKQFYGCISTTAFPVRSVSTLISPDLRLYCNALQLEAKPLRHVHPRSSVAELLAKVSSSGDKTLTLYHFYRPNRPASELVGSLMRFYQHVPQLETVSAFAQGKQWTPKLEAPRRSSSVKATPMKAFVPPQSYLMGLAERQAIQPGSSFGRRSLMWGHWF